MTVHLVQHRGLSGAALTIEYQDIILVLPGERLADEGEDVCATEEHFSSGERVAGDIRVGGLCHFSFLFRIYAIMDMALFTNAVTANRFLGSLAHSRTRSRYFALILGKISRHLGAGIAAIDAPSLPG